LFPTKKKKRINYLVIQLLVMKQSKKYSNLKYEYQDKWAKKKYTNNSTNLSYINNLFFLFVKKSEEIKLREKFYHDELKYHLRWDRRVSLY
jgi:hypothetical protein